MKTKQISRERYIETFCRDIRIHDRQVLYVSAKTHARMKDIAYLFREHHVTTTSLIDTILCHHIETYRSILEELKMEQRTQFLEGFNRRNDEDEERSDNL